MPMRSEQQKDGTWKHYTEEEYYQKQLSDLRNRHRSPEEIAASRKSDWLAFWAIIGCLPIFLVSWALSNHMGWWFGWVFIPTFIVCIPMIFLFAANSGAVLVVKICFFMIPIVGSGIWFFSYKLNWNIYVSGGINAVIGLLAIPFLWGILEEDNPPTA